MKYAHLIIYHIDCKSCYFEIYVNFTDSVLRNIPFEVYFPRGVSMHLNISLGLSLVSLHISNNFNVQYYIQSFKFINMCKTWF